MKIKSLLVWCVLLVLLAPSPAQAHTLLSELLLKMLLSDVVLAPPEGAFQSHEAHFRPISGGEVVPGFEFNQLEVPLAINSTIINRAVEPSPRLYVRRGFAYAFDPALGTFTRQAGTFGSLFGERALTIGRGRWNVGFNFQRATYDTLEGKRGLGKTAKSRSISCIRTSIQHNNTAGQTPAPFFEGDVIQNWMSLDLTSSVFSAYVTTASPIGWTSASSFQS